MPETNDARNEHVLNDISERITRNNQIIGVGTESSLQLRIDYTNELIDAYDPAVKGLDNKIVSIGQSINQLKDEIIVLISDAVGTSTVTYCGIVDTSSCGIGTSISGIGSTVHPWYGGISTCLIGYTNEYYDTVTANIWGFSSTSTNPFIQTTAVLSSASNTYGAGIGTFLFVTQNNSSYSAGVRVSLGDSATCVATQVEIDRKDGEISDLRNEIGHYIGVVNKLREQRWKSELERWGCLKAMQDAQNDNTILVGVRTAYTDSTYNSLFLK